MEGNRACHVRNQNHLAPESPNHLGEEHSCIESKSNAATVMFGQNVCSLQMKKAPSNKPVLLCPHESDQLII